MLLSEILARVPEDQREAKQRALMERIADGQYRVRYSNADELDKRRDNGLHADFFRMSMRRRSIDSGAAPRPAI
jgi:hypothetical protein